MTPGGTSFLPSRLGLFSQDPGVFSGQKNAPRLRPRHLPGFWPLDSAPLGPVSGVLRQGGGSGNPWNFALGHVFTFPRAA